MEEQTEQTDHRHPKPDGHVGINRLNFHFLATQPELGSRGGSDLGRGVAIVARSFGAQCEHEHEGTHRQQHRRSPQIRFDLRVQRQIQLQRTTIVYVGKLNS